jgi:hypothetical protein
VVVGVDLDVGLGTHGASLDAGDLEGRHTVFDLGAWRVASGEQNAGGRQETGRFQHFTPIQVGVGMGVAHRDVSWVRVGSRLAYREL